MEQLNRIELRGIVGSIKTTNFENNLCAHLAVATNYIYKSNDNSPVIETTWHNIIAWKSYLTKDIENLKKGDKVYVLGRLRARKYTDASGIERNLFEIVAKRIEKIRDKEALIEES